MQRHPRIELLSSQTLQSTPIFDLVRESVRLPSGVEQSLVVVDHPGAVCVAALGDDGRLLLVRQYRHAAGDWLLEIPAGRIDGGEQPLAAARRELEEETGHRATRWRLARAFFPAPGFCSELMSLFVATGLTPVPGGGLAADPDEELELAWRTPGEVLAGDCRDAKTLLAASLLAAGLLGETRADAPT